MMRNKLDAVSTHGKVMHTEYSDNEIYVADIS
jgi:hypothetical protein